jgi:hypothetical protein
MRAGNAAATVLAVTAALTGASHVSAHRLDECLQAARIAVEPDRVDLQLDLTPGVAVAEGLVSEIDRDRDGAFSAGEQHAYVAGVLAALRLDVDGRPLDVSASAFSFPDAGALRRGEGTINLRARASLAPQTAGTHHVVFRNTYRPDVSVYLGNALVPLSDRVAVTAQHHGAAQRDLTIDYVVRDGGLTSARYWWLGGAVAALGLLLMRR